MFTIHDRPLVHRLVAPLAARRTEAHRRGGVLRGDQQARRPQRRRHDGLWRAGDANERFPRRVEQLGVRSCGVWDAARRLHQAGADGPGEAVGPRGAQEAAAAELGGAGRRELTSRRSVSRSTRSCVCEGGGLGSSNSDAGPRPGRDRDQALPLRLAALLIGQLAAPRLALAAALAAAGGAGGPAGRRQRPRRGRRAAARRGWRSSRRAPGCAQR